MKILLIDNYDSFTYNLVQYLEIAGAEVTVCLNDQISLAEINAMKPDGIVISPGPGTPSCPEDVGISREIITNYDSNIPVLGVCLGHQLIGHIFGGNIAKTEPIHGQKSLIKISQKTPLFKNLPSEFPVMRYHSLLVDTENFPEELEITSETDDHLIMSLQHKQRPLYGVQFHPESIGTKEGQMIIDNFVGVCEK